MTAKPKFQRRHYEVIADILAGAKPMDDGGTWAKTALAYWKAHVLNFAEQFAIDNGSFLKDRFLHRCQYVENETY